MRTSFVWMKKDFFLALIKELIFYRVDWYAGTFYMIKVFLFNMFWHLLNQTFCNCKVEIHNSWSGKISLGKSSSQEKEFSYRSRRKVTVKTDKKTPKEQHLNNPFTKCKHCIFNFFWSSSLSYGFPQFSIPWIGVLLTKGDCLALVRGL